MLKKPNALGKPRLLREQSEISLAIHLWLVTLYKSYSNSARGQTEYKNNKRRFALFQDAQINIKIDYNFTKKKKNLFFLRFQIFKR